MTTYAVTQKYPRYRTDLPVEVLNTVTREVERLSLVNISLGGVFVRADAPLPPGSVVALRMDAAGAPFGATARVVHIIDEGKSVEKQHPPGMGLEFERLRPDARDALQRYVHFLANAVKGRCAPRFSAKERVRVRLATDSQLNETWIEDISLGGLFLATDAPPSIGTCLDVELETPGGSLLLAAEVVHVVDERTAAFMGHAQGAGLQFLDLDGAKRDALERYVEGLAPSLSEGGERSSGSLQVPNAVMRLVKRVFEGIDRGDVDRALGLDLDATHEQRRTRVERLLALFGSPPPGTTAPQVARLEAASRALTRIQHRIAREEARGGGPLPDDAARLVRRGDDPGADASASSPSEASSTLDVRSRREAQILLESAEACLCAGVDDRAREQALCAVALCSARDIRTRALRVLVQADAAKEAVALGRELVAEDPKDPAAWEAVFTLYEKKGMVELAVRAAETLVTLRPKDARWRARVKALKAKL